MTGWERVPCPLCGATDGTVALETAAGPFGPTPPVVLRRCACGLGITDPQPRGDALAELYRGVAYYTHRPPHGVRARIHRLTDRLQVRGPFASLRGRIEATTNLPRFTSRLGAGEFPLERGRRLLDFGCGGGEYVRLGIDLGLDATGVEPDPVSRAAAQAAGLPVVATLEDADAQGRGPYDLAILSHVLEHLDEPIEALAAVRRRLVPGGRLLVAVPNLDALQGEVFADAWIGWDMPRHLWHFTPAVLDRLVRAAGFSPCHCSTIELAGYERASAALARSWDRPVPRYRPGSLPRLERAGRGTEIVMVATVAPDAPGGEGASSDAA